MSTRVQDKPPSPLPTMIPSRPPRCVTERMSIRGLPYLRGDRADLHASTGMTLLIRFAALAAGVASLEASIAASRQQLDRAAKARLSLLHAELTETRRAIASRASDEADALRAGWAEAQMSMVDGFAALRVSVQRRSNEHRDPPVQSETTEAALNTEDVIDFAIHALQEAEYAVLVGADGRAVAPPHGTART